MLQPPKVSFPSILNALLSSDSQIHVKKWLLVVLQEFVGMLGLKKGQKVLDVGCGIGGGDFYMAKV